MFDRLARLERSGRHFPERFANNKAIIAEQADMIAVDDRQNHNRTRMQYQVTANRFAIWPVLDRPRPGSCGLWMISRGICYGYWLLAIGRLPKSWSSDYGTPSGRINITSLPCSLVLDSVEISVVVRATEAVAAVGRTGRRDVRGVRGRE